MKNQLIECVPNFSEGRNYEIITKIANVISSVQGVTLLYIDKGFDANRTVYTFVGEPSKVIEAAFLAIKCASILIDMRNHKGEHPRIGACDVCPIVPIEGVSMEDAILLSKKLAARVARELNIPVYLYEHSQPNKARSNLSIIRKGEYEMLPSKMILPEWKPDFGIFFNEKSGATVIGARDFLIAYNVNLNTKSVEIANEIAAEIRESGYLVNREGKGDKERIPGALRYVKAIGWYMEHFGIAQVSCNLTNYRETPIHKVFEEIKMRAIAKGADVTGSELIALIPLEAMLMAGRYYAEILHNHSNLSERELVSIAVERLGLTDCELFNPDERIIEYAIKRQQGN
ncbi:MAG: glutamate formimidoyltransferase [Bacteroidia bacterium]|nr:glutamate formimidoyltransferase [Bacteroidia bacterium]